jgi:hypothetical protein
VRFGNEAAVQLLLDARADVNVRALVSAGAIWRRAA